MGAYDGADGADWQYGAGRHGCGGSVAGELADRFGRKHMFMATLVLYSGATGLCSLAWNFESLLCFRFLVGFGLGGQLPVAVTLVTEFSPPAVRGKFIVLLESFWGIGWLAAAFGSYLVIPHFGWQSAFLIGALPALYVFYCFHWIPESVRYLLRRDGKKRHYCVPGRTKLWDYSGCWR